MNLNALKIRARTPEKAILLEDRQPWLAENGEQLLVENGSARRVSAMAPTTPDSETSLVVVRGGVTYEAPFEKFVDFIASDNG